MHGQFFKKDFITLPIVLFLGAISQALLFALLPPRLALVPIAVFAFHQLLEGLKFAVNPSKHSLTRTVIPGRTSAQIPDLKTGLFPSVPSSQKIVVFHLGVRFNHPLGLLSPGAKTAGTHFQKCLETVNAHVEEYGLLGCSYWRAAERATQNTLMVVFYFKDLNALNRFAHGEVHREAWRWLEKEAPGHIGFFHEMFLAERGAWESVYIGMPPTLLGGTVTRCEFEDGDDDEEKETAGEVHDKERKERWVRNLVHANGSSALRLQFSRMGQAWKDAERKAKKEL
jgi:fumagillin biosynthesis monooxygenase